MARPHIQVILADDAVPENLRAALQRVDATASFAPLSEAVRGDTGRGADALVMVVPENTSRLAGSLRTVFDRLAAHPRATLVLSPKGPTDPAFVHAPTVPVSFGHDLDEDGLSARLGLMLEMRRSLDSLHRGLVANRRTGQTLAQRYHSQLRLASQLQREFLPESLPRYGPISFNVLFRPIDYVSGDIYDVHALDEDHVGLALADASGHGIPAALLTVYIKRALRGKALERGSYRILPPDEVLAGLNEDLLDADLAECPFVAAAYAVLNIRTLELSLARAGLPYPIHRTAAGELQRLECAGGVVGVATNAVFEVQQLQLARGDSVLLFSDGLERVVASPTPRDGVPVSEPERKRGARRMRGAERKRGAERPGQPAGELCAVASARGNGHSATAVLNPPGTAGVPAGPPGTDALSASSWWSTLRDNGPVAAFEQVAHRQRALRRMGYPLDDLTLLLLQVDA
ncbi:MAG: SpoIIE family protein phosphatase [Planctomycetota bacterium]